MVTGCLSDNAQKPNPLGHAELLVSWPRVALQTVFKIAKFQKLVSVKLIFFGQSEESLMHLQRIQVHPKEVQLKVIRKQPYRDIKKHEDEWSVLQTAPVA